MSASEDESWAVMNMSLASQHRLTPHLIKWQPCANAKDVSSISELYDPTADDEDEEWMAKTHGVGRCTRDAILSCAGCFTSICFVSKRLPLSSNKIKYQTQQVVNCSIEEYLSGRRLSPRLQASGQNRKKRKVCAKEDSKDTDSPILHRNTQTDTDDIVVDSLPASVVCLNCSNVVGCYDSTNGYVLDDVIPSC